MWGRMNLLCRLVLWVWQEFARVSSVLQMHSGNDISDWIGRWLAVAGRDQDGRSLLDALEWQWCSGRHHLQPRRRLAAWWQPPSSGGTERCGWWIGLWEHWWGLLPVLREIHQAGWERRDYHHDERISRKPQDGSNWCSEEKGGGFASESKRAQTTSRRVGITAVACSPASLRHGIPVVDASRWRSHSGNAHASECFGQTLQGELWLCFDLQVFWSEGLRSSCGGRCFVGQCDPQWRRWQRSYDQGV